MVKYFYLTLLTVLLSKPSMAQSDSVQLKFSETFVVNMTILNKLKYGKIHCGWLKGRVLLVKSKVENILYFPANNILDSSMLQNIHFFIVSKKQAKKIKLNKNFTVTLSPSSTNQYFAIRRFLESKNETVYYHPGPFVIGILSCQDKTNSIDNYVKKKLEL